MRVYLSGPMTGLPYFNHPAFEAAATHLQRLGHEVFNPAREAELAYGRGLFDNPTGDATRLPSGYLRERLGADLRYICAEAHAIALMPGWAHSSGARAEHATAMALHLTPIYLLEAHCTPLAEGRPSTFPIPDASASR